MFKESRREPGSLFLMATSGIHVAVHLWSLRIPKHFTTCWSANGHSSGLTGHVAKHSPSWCSAVCTAVLHSGRKDSICIPNTPFACLYFCRVYLVLPGPFLNWKYFLIILNKQRFVYISNYFMDPFLPHPHPSHSKDENVLPGEPRICIVDKIANSDTINRIKKNWTGIWQKL